LLVIGAETVLFCVSMCVKDMMELA
jgi:hypothetical protein